MVLVKILEQTADAYLSEKVTHAIVTVLACEHLVCIFFTDFNDAQRQATKDAGTIVGLQDLCIISKPTAAAIAYGLNKKGGESQIIVIDYLVKLYKKKTGTYVTSNQRALGKLKREVEKAKCMLSSQQSTRIEIESFEDGDEFSETLTRAKFKELNMDLFSKTTKPVVQVLKDANVEEVDEVVLVVVLPVFPRSSNSSRNFSAARSLPKVSTPTRPLGMVLLFKVVFYRAKLEVKILSLPSYPRY